MDSVVNKRKNRPKPSEENQAQERREMWVGGREVRKSTIYFTYGFVVAGTQQRRMCLKQRKNVSGHSNLVPFDSLCVKINQILSVLTKLKNINWLMFENLNSKRRRNNNLIESAVKWSDFSELRIFYLFKISIKRYKLHRFSNVMNYFKKI